ncbi:MAG TPA: peptidoglycan DD-metalloendopeptidase family protein [Actinomycetota bacterium]|nr:peptidoglycan DD-metalloendopeptidase family protein [Actinomycetota bacterium]
MRGRLGRGAIVAVFLSTILIPAVGSYADSSSLQDLERQNARVQNRLDEVRGSIRHLEGEAGSLEREVQTLDAEIMALRSEVERLSAEIVEVESKVRSAQARIDATQLRIDAIKDRATAQAVALYKAGATDTLNALLDSDSLADLDSRLQMLGVAAQESTGALIRYGRLQVTIEAQHRELFAYKTELSDTIARRKVVLADLDRRYAKQKAALSKLEATISHKHHHEGSLEAKSAQLAGLIRAAQARRAVENLGTSAEGFMWPLNGPITSYYGERWGRMHTGVDINGYTGQPVVSSKAGRVILASYYSGYGNCVIIDHGGGFSTLYAHLSDFAVSAGEDVGQAQIIGDVGCTGNCYGDHLHFEVRINGSPVDPLDYLP